MKTNHLLLMAMTAMLTASCSQNEIMEVSPDAAPAVGFNVYATAQTRGTITDNETTNTGIKNTTGFGVLAYYTGQSAWSAAAASTAPNFMYNQQVKWNTTPNPDAWEYSPVKYWPNTEGDKISFFAYAPYSDQKASPKPSGITLSGNAATDKGAPTLKFTLQATPDKLVDLVATNATGVHAPTGASKVIDITKSTDAVKFKFDHVLTRLNFKAKLDAAPATGTYIFVTGMRLLGNNNNSGTTFYSSATYKFTDGKWDYTTATPTAQPTDYDVKAIMPLAKTTINGFPTKYTTPGIEITATGNNLLKTTPTPAHYLFFIPPTDATGVAKDKVKVQIDYDIVTVDPNIAIGYSITSTKATVSLPEGTMARGKAYDYLFTIGLEKVQISATVEPWGTATNTPIPSANAANTVTAITTAIGTLNTAKGSNPNCNYFVVNVTGGAIPTTLNISSATVTNFVSGDKIEIISTSASSVSLTPPTGWTRISATGSTTSIIIQKN